MILSKAGNRIPQAKEKSCIILGNGPSLKTSLLKHPDFFTKHPLICVNSFSITAEFTILKPEYYVILDHGFWKSDAAIITETLNALTEKTTWPLQLLVPQMAAKSKKFEMVCKKNPNLQLTYFNYSVFKGFRNIGYWLFSKNLAMPQAQNVVVAALFLSINLGFKEVFLFGADHSWHQHLHIDDSNKLFLKHIHFYDNEEKVSFVPLVRAIHLTETIKTQELFTNLAKMFSGYDALESYANYRNCKIYNASEISFIDAFERKKI